MKYSLLYSGIWHYACYLLTIVHLKNTLQQRIYGFASVNKARIYSSAAEYISAADESDIAFINFGIDLLSIKKSFMSK